MFIKTGLFRFLSICCLILFVASFAFADTIRLKNGSIIKGRIISFDNGSFTIVFGDGNRERQMVIRADEIASIKFDSRTRPATNINTSNRTSDNPPNTRTTNDGNNTIITVGGNRNGTNPPKIKTPDNRSSNSGSATPLTLNVNVLADETANGWTNSDFVVQKGQRIRISAKGRISLGNGRYTAPRGLMTLPDENKLIKDKPTGGLIAVIGDDNNEFIFIGDQYEFVAERDGSLFLGVNEGKLSDNSGSFAVRVQIFPAEGK